MEFSQAADIRGASRECGGVVSRLLEAVEAEATLPGFRAGGRPALLLQGGSVVEPMAYLRSVQRIFVSICFPATFVLAGRIDALPSDVLCSCACRLRRRNVLSMLLHSCCHHVGVAGQGVLPDATQGTVRASLLLVFP